MPRLPQSWAARYGFAALSAAAATALRVALDPALGDRFPFTTLYLAVLLAAWYGGFGPAVAATLVGVPLAARFLLQPRDSFAVAGAEDQAGVALYVLTGLGVGLLGGSMTAARRRAEAAAAAADRQRERERTTLASIGDAVIVTDAAGVVTSVNPEAERLTGWPVGEAVGRPLDAVFVIRNEFTRQPVGSPAARVLREGVVVGLANHTLLVARDGTERPIDDSAAPVRAADGAVAGVVLVFRDVTERRRAEQAVRGSEARKAAILDAALDAIITIDHEGRVVEFNPAAERTFGYARGDAVGRELADLIIPPALREGHHRGLARYLATGEGPVLGKRIEMPAVRADGSEFPVELAITRIPADGPPQFTAYLRDISERVRGDRRRGVRLAVSQIVARAEGVADAAPRVLEAACDGLGWAVGALWLVDDRAGVLRCAAVRHPPGLGEQFAAATREQTFAPGEGLPGRVWQSGRPLWLPDVTADDQFPRRPAAAAGGLRGGFGVPVFDSGTVGVVEFYGPEVREPDPDLLEMMTTLGGQVGQFVERKRAEAALRESERRFREFADTAPALLWVTGPDGSCSFLSRGWYEFTGQAEGTGLGFGWLDAVHPDDRAAAGDAFRAANARREPFALEHRVRRADGEYRWVLDAGRPRSGPGGEFLGYIGSVIDITDRKRAEDALRAGERELADFFENAAVGLHWVGPDGTILRANKAELDMLGYAPGEYVGRNVAEFHADAPVIGDILARLTAGEELHDFPARLRCKDGSVRDVLIDSSVLREGGRFVHTRCFTRDVTGRVRAEQALREGERQLRLVTDIAPVMLVRCDPETRYRFVNKAYADRFGLTPDQIVGRRIPDVLGEAAYQTFAHHVEAVLAGRRVEFEVEIPYDSGPRVMRCAYEPERDAGGRVVGFVAALADVTGRVRAEQALRAGEARLKAIVDHSPAVIFLKDPAGRYLLVNRRYEEVARAAGVEGPYLGRTDAELLPPELADRFRRDDVEVLDTRRVKVYEESMDLAGGRWTGLTTKFPLLDEAGEAYAVCGISLDITDRKRAEEAVRESEERLRLALTAGRMGVWDWDVRTDELRWSDNLEAIHGLPPGTFGGTFAAFRELVHPDDRDRVFAALARALEERSDYDVEFRTARPDGAVHWIAGKGKVFADAAGPVRMLGVGTDVTDRRRAEQGARFLADASAALTAVNDPESTLQKVAGLAVPAFADWCVIDLLGPDGAVRRVSVAHTDPAKVELAHEVRRRFPPDPDAPRGVWHILRTGEAELTTDISDDLITQSVPDPEQRRLIRGLGLRSYIGVPLAARGQVYGVIVFVTAESGRRYDDRDLAVARDLAHRAGVAVENARLYQALREADRRKDEFLAMLAHELRNPLAPIRNALFVIRRPGVDPAVADQVTGMMERQVEHLVRLVDDLLDVSRIMRGKIELRREPIDLAAVVARAVETVQPVIDAEGHDLTVEVSADPLRVDGDLVRLAQVVGNLLHNAAKYTERGGQIRLTAGREGGEAVVRVRDTGVGIAPEFLPRIFDMFVQADRRTKSSRGGMGIGLTLVRTLVELHGGRVEAHSGGPGTGSEFVVRLPLLKGEGGGVRGGGLPASASPPTPHASPLKILVVDDNLDAAESLAMLLRIQGHDVRVAADGPAALGLAAADPPAVAFLDLGMPGMDGLELARRFRADPALAGVRLIALTGWGQDEDRRRTKEAGFEHHLVKPADPETVRRLFDGPGG